VAARADVRKVVTVLFCDVVAPGQVTEYRIKLKKTG
jgi:hypothetical protein